MTARVAGKVAFVTGGASGIGAALAGTLADAGAQVWIADRQIGPARELAQRLGAHAVELDVRDYRSFQAAVDEAMRGSGRIDYLFNNAGIAIGGEADAYTLDDWNDVLEVNLHGVVHGIQAVYPIMVAQHGGHIVNTASMAGLVAGPGSASYTASKYAVVAISRVLRMEAERHGVRVSVLCPGVIRTPVLTGGKYGRVGIPGLSDDDVLDGWERMRPLAPEKFAERALRKVLRNRAIIVVPAWWKLAWYLERLSPALMERMGRRSLTRLRAFASDGDIRRAAPRGPS